MTTTERSRREIREIAGARLSYAREQLNHNRMETLSGLKAAEVPKDLIKGLKSIEESRKALKAQEEKFREAAKAAGFYWTTGSWNNDSLTEFDNSTRREAIRKQFREKEAKLNDAARELNETLALAFSPAEFKTAFENFLKAIA